MYDLIVIGGGVLGTFHAYHAMEKGLKVALIEKDKAPQDATTRNFGQVVPSGMDSKWQAYGRESLKIYKKIQKDFDITVRNEGSVYIASNAEEMQLIEELSEINKANEYASELLDKASCLKLYPGLRSDYAVGGLFFPEEVTVEPRTMIHRLQAYLVQEKGLTLFTSKNVVACEYTGSFVKVETACQSTFEAQQVIICNGREFKTLYPSLFAESDLEVSKLQMMQTKPQDKSYKLPGSILTGLSIRRYEAFYECPSFAEIKSKEPVDSLEKKWGVHILFKQAIDGSVILGDSHEYADAKNMDDLGYDLNMDIDDFMLAKAKEIITLPNYEIAHRWFGMYSQCKSKDIFQHSIDGHIHIVTGIGGKGMTGSAGFSKEHIDQLFNI
ncbi:TIGR03364 family FAD-dependent oxidoreductase [Marinilongibacter aquaticus]|uniref:TIGR03364 family FAD-dependent oxidoreductase n=1 Tax=Marinilongibacter aquaticus TaxID=2975157 RepID=UPI0021BD5AA9|nr:TIGR03364 family FAD-dependent oxidoreductase [Marinilongibacter aquaticus]UBM59049.1 TIGR03364 family FAD-dependent oxidoreductase [Marinilongibacter aquaticus]